MLILFAVVVQRLLAQAYSSLAAGRRISRNMACTVADILLEMVESGSYLKDVGAAASVRTNIVASLCAKIKQLTSLSTGDAVKLRDSVTTANFPEDTAAILKTSIDSALASALAGNCGGKKVALTQQQLVNACSYPSGGDWVVIEQQPFNVDRAISILAMRWSNLGVRSMHETTTIRNAIAIVLAAYLREKKAWPRYHEIFRWVNFFKGEMERNKKPWAFDHIVKYPTTPLDLPPAILAVAYETGDGPVRKDVPLFDQIAGHIPLRKNSISIGNGRAAMSALQHHGASADPFGEAPMLPNLRVFGNSRQRRMSQQCAQQPQRPSALPALCDQHGDWEIDQPHGFAGWQSNGDMSCPNQFPGISPLLKGVLQT